MKTLLLVLTLLPLFIFGQSLPPPTISHETGFYENEFDVEISHPDPDVTIFYTTDGSEPSLDNLTGKEWTYKKEYPSNPGDAFGELLKDTIWTYEYSGPLLIKNRGEERDRYADISTSYYTNAWYNDMSEPDSVDVFKGTVLRVVAYSNGTYSEVVTKNYFVTPEGESRYSLPVASVTIDPVLYYSYEEGLNVPGKLFDEWRQDNPTEALTSLSPANFRASGGSSEIPIHFSYIVENEEVLNHGAGLRLHGSGSRFYPNRSFRLYAKSGYGVSMFEYPFFSDYSEDSFKRIIFRNSGNDTESTMFRDGFIQETVKNLNFDTQAYQPVIVFINGEYVGIKNIRERFDDKYFERVYGVDGDDLDFIENDGLVDEGDDLFYNQLMDFLENNDLDVEANYQEVLTMIDIDNFTDFFITEIFVNNSDWPHNNNEFWRKRVTFDPAAEYGHDGRFRWVLKDLDVSFGRYESVAASLDNLETLLYVTNDNTYDRSTLLLRKLLENHEYKEFFINRFLDLINTNFKPERLLDYIDYYADKLEPEIDEFTKRWSPQQYKLTHAHPVTNKVEWLGHVDDLREFAQDRSFYQIKYMKHHFEDQDVDVLINTSDIDHGIVQINTIQIDENTLGINDYVYPWSGSYFKNVPITLKAIAKPGYVFSHWSGEINDSLPEITVSLNYDTYVKANFVPEDELSIEEIAFDASKEITVFPNPFNDHINILADSYDGNYTIYSATGTVVKEGVFSSQKIRLDKLERGVYILKINSGETSYTHRIVKE